MTRKRSGPKDPKNGAGKHGSTQHGETPADASKDGQPDRKNGADIVSLTSSPAFDIWLDRQTKKLVQATATQPSDALVDLIRGWPAASAGGNSPKKK